MTGAELAGCLAAQEEGSEEGTAGDGVATPAAKAAGQPQPVMPYVATLHLTSEAGYTARVVLKRGKLARARVGAVNGSVVLGTACAVNPERDAVEPFRLVITNTTSKFRAKPAIDIIGHTPYGELPGVLGEIGYSSGPECVEFTGDSYPGDEEGGYLADGPSYPLGPGEQNTAAQGFLIITDYYSPRHPEGNPGMFQNSVLELVPQTGGDSFTVASAEGVLVPQGNQAVQNAAVHNSIAVLPGGSGGCLVQPPCEAAFRVE